MPNGKKIASDRDVLIGFYEDYLFNGVQREDRMAARWGCSVKQVYELWSKTRFNKLIDFGVSQRTGYLTEFGGNVLMRMLVLNQTDI